MDIIRQAVNGVLFDMVYATASSASNIKSLQLLYHRESCQSYSILTTTKSNTPSTTKTTTSQQQQPSLEIHRS